MYLEFIAICGVLSNADLLVWLQRRITAFAVSHCTVETTAALFDEVKIWLQHARLLSFLATQKHHVIQSTAAHHIETPPIPCPLRLGMTVEAFEEFQQRTKAEKKMQDDTERLRGIHSRKRATSASYRQVLENTAQKALNLPSESVQLEELPDLVSRIVSLSVEAIGVTLVS